MPSGPDPSGAAPSTPNQPPSATPPSRDTDPTSLVAHSTLPPSPPEPASEAFAPVSVEAPSTPTTARQTPSGPAGVSPSESSPLSGDTDHSTLHSAPQPGSGPSAQWDERRIVHLERELDQLSARERLLEKRVADLNLRLRTFAIVTTFVVLSLVLALWILGLD